MLLHVQGGEAMNGKRDLVMLMIGAFIGWLATTMTKVVGA